jgi:transcriptional regulator with XRE-family HTH domain
MFVYFIRGCGIMEHVDILKMCFSNILYFKRKELNLSQGKMAEKCCISLRQYADIESGKRFPSISLINFIINGEIDINKFVSDIQKLGYLPKDRVKKDEK